MVFYLFINLFIFFFINWNRASVVHVLDVSASIPDGVDAGATRPERTRRPHLRQRRIGLTSGFRWQLLEEMPLDAGDATSRDQWQSFRVAHWARERKCRKRRHAQPPSFQLLYSAFDGVGGVDPASVSVTSSAHSAIQRFRRRVVGGLHGVHGVGGGCCRIRRRWNTFSAPAVRNDPTSGASSRIRSITTRVNLWLLHPLVYSVLTLL